MGLNEHRIEDSEDSVYAMAGTAKAGGLGGALVPPLFWKEMKYFSITLKNVLTMVNGYTRQF